jgi:hypothetical protein
MNNTIRCTMLPLAGQGRSSGNSNPLRLPPMRNRSSQTVTISANPLVRSTTGRRRTWSAMAATPNRHWSPRRRGAECSRSACSCLSVMEAGVLTAGPGRGRGCITTSPVLRGSAWRVPGVTITLSQRDHHELDLATDALLPVTSPVQPRWRGGRRCPCPAGRRTGTPLSRLLRPGKMWMCSGLMQRRHPRWSC